MINTRTQPVIQYSFILAVLMIVLILTGCQPGSNPAQLSTDQSGSIAPSDTPPPTRCEPITASNDTGLTIITLMDGSQIYLGENTEMIFTPAGYCPGLEEHHILIKRGQVAVFSQLPQDKMFQINSPAGYLAQVSKTGLVTYNPDEGTFRMDCTSSPCTVGIAMDSSIALNCGESGSLDAEGVYSGPSTINLGELMKFGAWLLPLCPITPAPSSTPDFGATATAACASFQEEFALTPCPPANP